MATQYSNKPIVTDGLVYALDFGNPKSYVSGSTTARNLKYDTIISASILTFGGATIPNLQNGLLKMVAPIETTGSTIAINTRFSELIPTGSFTIQTVTTLTGDIFISQGPSSTRLVSNNNGIFGWYINPMPYGDPSDFAKTITKSVPTGLKHITYRYSSGSYDLFVNGVPARTTARNTSVSSNTGNMTINGRGTAGTNLGTLDLGNLYIYNRALTSDEIYSNYLIQAQRYGLPTTPKPYSIDENAYLFLSQSGITDPIITGSIDTFVRGLKSASLWDKMIAIYPFVGTGSAGVNLTGSHSWNLKDPTTAYYKLAFTGSWNGSTSGSAPSGSNTSINTGVLPYEYYPFKSDSNQHISILSYDTPTTSSYLMGTEGTNNTSSFSIYYNSGSESGSITGSINNAPLYGIPSSGPLGLITVSRTGSNSLTIARNGVTSSFAVPASGALSTGIYLGAINNNGIAIGNSPYNISFASVGTGLTNNEIIRHSTLVNTLNYSLRRSINSEYQALLNYATAQGFTLPSTNVQAAQNRLLTELKTAGIWDKLDTFALFATDAEDTPGSGTSEFALIDWKRLVQYSAVNSPTFSLNGGFQGNGTTSYVDTNFNPLSNGVNYTLNNAGRFFWVDTRNKTNQWEGSRDNSSGNASRNANSNQFTINGGTGTLLTGTINFQSDGFKAMNRTSNIDVVAFATTTRFDATQSSTVILPANQSVLRNGAQYNDCRFRFYAMGASLVAENTAFYNAMNTYFTSL
jgi:hypothetical protein